MSLDDPQPGEEFVAPNQGTNITPYSVKVRVVWFDGVDVHYRVEDSLLVRSTPIERFRETING